MNILMTGATGMIGKKLGKRLVERGHEIWVITRDVEKAREVLPFPAHLVEGNLERGPIPDNRIEKVEAVIHLAGEPVAGARWNEERKEKILKSRREGTRNLIESLPKEIKVVITASAIGYYGDRGDEILTETSKPGKDFLSEVCQAWEREGDRVFARVVHLRTGLVLDREEGALPKLLFPFRSGVGGVIGSGQQWMSWIHIDDLIEMYIWALDNEKAHDVYNAVAPYPVRNRELTETLTEALGVRSLGLSIPGFVLKALMGEASKLALFSQRVSSQKIQKAGFQFQHPALREALFQICEPFRAGEEIFSAEQFVPEPPEKVFPFFSEAKNLEVITPSLLNFRLKTMSTSEIHQGTLIDYRLKIRGVPTLWKTRIEEWHPPQRFVDNQLRGPYKLWRHTHEFTPFAGGTLLTDRVRYKLPLGFAGWLAAAAFVRGDVEKIFAHRRKIISRQKF